MPPDSCVIYDTRVFHSRYFAFFAEKAKFYEQFVDNYIVDAHYPRSRHFVVDVESNTHYGIHPLAIQDNAKRYVDNHNGLKFGFMRVAYYNRKWNEDESENVWKGHVPVIFQWVNPGMENVSYP